MSALKPFMAVYQSSVERDPSFEDHLGFVCMADDVDHAVEQFHSAYGDECREVLVTVIDLTAIPNNYLLSATRRLWEPENDSWAAHPVYSVSAWQEEVTNGDSRSGYVDWVNSQLEQEKLR